MTPAEQLAIDIREAVAVVKRVAESLPGFTFGTEFDMLDGEAEPPCACDAERFLTPNRPS